MSAIMKFVRQTYAYLDRIRIAIQLVKSACKSN